MLDYNEVARNIREVYSYLEDEKSKRIFELRYKYLLEYNRIPLCTYATKKCKQFAKELIESKQPIIFYGAGVMAKTKFMHLPWDISINKDVNIIFCDKKFAEIKNFEGFPVISPAELVEKYIDCDIIITSDKFFEEIKDSLLENGFNENQIKNTIFPKYYLGDIEEQYFDEEIIRLKDNEIFVDAGVFDAETSILFAKKCNNIYKKIYLLEPNKQNFENSKNKLEMLEFKNYELLEYGLWNEKDILKFRDGTTSGRISDDGSISVNVNSLDNILGCKETVDILDLDEDKRVTYIKMDIEGAELNALKGAENIIKSCKPRLAISIYHKSSDIFDIPLYIKSLVPEYKIYIRHYTTGLYETVLYGVIE